MIYPDLTTFIKKTKQGNLIPVYSEMLADQDTPVSVYERLRAALRERNPHYYTFLLESVEGGENIARYSFLGGNPREIISAYGNQVKIERSNGQIDLIEKEPLAALEHFMSRYKPVHDENLPRFFGGAVGYLAYEAITQFEKVPLCKGEGLGMPDMLYAITDTLIMFDHVKHTLKLVANVLIEDDPEATYAEAEKKIMELRSFLETNVPRKMINASVDPEKIPLKSNTPKEKFLDDVESAKEYIRAGDIIQVVLSQRFEVEGRGEALNIYRALRTINPSPYMFCLEFGDHRLVGSSPEVHVRNEDGKVNIRPIAGTRPRSRDEKKDKAFENELLADPKECAEHLMLVDLARNDIGRVCKWGSVKVTEFMTVERYSHVMHIVSNVTGNLKPKKNAYDLLRATFPAGTLTGAPKIRAMEIIAEKELSKRGPYSGTVGYFGFDGNLDCCITIRTVVLDRHSSYVQAGAGIVADSVPQKEYEESQNKARGMLDAIALARAYQQENLST